MDNLPPGMKKSARGFLKESGNEEFKTGNYGRAIEQYSKAIKLDPKDIEMLSNRSLAHLKHGLHSMALKDAEAVLRQSATHKKCIVRKIQSLWGLRRYEEALEFLESNISTRDLETSYYQELKSKAHKFIKHSQGEYDMKEILSLPPGECHEIGEYMGSIKIVTIPGKGRGVIATADIAPGELILVSKALSMTFCKEEKVGNEIPPGVLKYLVQNVCEKLSLDPHIRDEFCGLTPKPNPKSTTGSKWIWKNTDDFLEEQSMILAVRDRIVLNLFSHYVNEMDSVQYGLWILLSYFNHDCIDSNVFGKFHGNIAMARVIKPVKKGEELTLSYVPPQFPQRFENLKQTFHFLCSCRLCLFECGEDKSTKELVNKTLQSIKAELKTLEIKSWETNEVYQDFMNTGNPSLTDSIKPLIKFTRSQPPTEPHQLKTLLALVRRLILLRRDNPSFNMAMLDPCVDQVCIQLYFYRKFAECVEIMKALRSTMNHSMFVEDLVQQDMIISSCYAFLGKHEVVKMWNEVLLKDMFRAHGPSMFPGEVNKISQTLHEEIEELSDTIDLLVL